MWRGGLPPLGREAAPYIFQIYRVAWTYDCFAAERGQAPSPQQLSPQQTPSPQGLRYSFSLT
ncbi:hypothetical protein F6R97_30395 [Pseudomonas sp. JV414]|nr:hypothetical protein [Pseudomonas sp. JV414]